MSRKYLFLAAITGFIVALDQATKMYIHTQFYLGESYTIIPDFFDLTYVRNKGAAFGILSEAHEIARNLIFLSLPPIAMALIIFMLRSLPQRDFVQTFALSIIFGGAFGNYIDRLRLGYVVDFLDFHWMRMYTFPAFNVADSSIVVGVSILFLVYGLEVVAEMKTKKTMQEKTMQEKTMQEKTNKAT